MDWSWLALALGFGIALGFGLGVMLVLAAVNAGYNPVVGYILARLGIRKRG